MATWLVGSLVLASAALLLAGEGLRLLQRRTGLQLVPPDARRRAR